MTKLLLIALGGAVGSIGRYLLGGWVQRLAPGGGTFPIGTLAVNALGCLLIGILAAAFAGPHLVRDETRLLLMVGILGGFTTFSTFGLETFELINEGDFARAALNIALSLIVCLAAVWIGYRVAERIFGA